MRKYLEKKIKRRELGRKERIRKGEIRLQEDDL